jgi:hypothetical protein
MNRFMLKSLAKAALFCGWTVLAGWLPAQASQPVIQGTGLCRFILHDYELPPASQATIDRIVTELLQRHREVFGFQPAADFHVRIRIFGRQEEYLSFARTNHPAANAETGGGRLNATNLAGYYALNADEVVTWRQRDPSYLANNILHECSHAIMHRHYQNLPHWLSEGCAVYFSFPLQMQDEADVRSLNRRWTLLNQWWWEDSLPKLEGFLNLDRHGQSTDETTRFYTVSWSVFQFFMSTPENRKVLRQLLVRLQPSAPVPTDCAGALNALYPGGLNRFERDWHEWIRKGTSNLSLPGKPSR